MGAAGHARHAGDLEPKLTQTTHIDVSLAKANSLKLQYYITILLHYYITILLYYYITNLLYYYFTI